MSGNANGSKEYFAGGVRQDTELLAEKHGLFRVREDLEENFCSLRDLETALPWNMGAKHFWKDVRRTLIPLRRAIKMNLDDLPGVGDVVPVAVGLPAFRNNLNEDASDGRLRNVGNTLHVGLDVDFGLFVFD